MSHGVRTHSQLPAVDLKSTPLTTRADSHVHAAKLTSNLAFWHSSCPSSVCLFCLFGLSLPWPSSCLSPSWCWGVSLCLSPYCSCCLLFCWPHVLSSWVLGFFVVTFACLCPVVLSSFVFASPEVFFGCCYAFNCHFPTNLYFWLLFSGVELCFE